MAHYPNSMPPSVTPSTLRPQETARAQRVNQAQYVEERLRNGLPPVAVAGVAALLTQLETMQSLPGVSLSIVVEVAGYRRTLVCQNNAWDGYDLTHQFLDDRSTAMYGPSQGTVFEQEASLRMMPANAPPLPPPQMVSSQPQVHKHMPMTPAYAGSPAFGASHRAPHMVLQTTSQPPMFDREPSGSRLPPFPSPDLAGRSTSEQAVIVALQAVANYPDSSDFIRAVQLRIPGPAAYLPAAAQPSGCDPPATPMNAESTAGPSWSAVAVSSEEAGRKRLTQEIAPLPLPAL